MTKRVMIIDDDLQMLQNLQKDLAKYSKVFSLMIAENTVKAIKILEGHKISIVVSALEEALKDRPSLLSHLRENYPDVQLLIITGEGSYEDEKSLLESCKAKFVRLTNTILRVETAALAFAAILAACRDS